MTWPVVEPGEGAPVYDNDDPFAPPPLYVDAASILDGTHTAPQPTVGGRRSDGLPLLYAAAVNVLLGAPEAGKTLVAGAMAADELFGDGRVLWLDLDHNGAPAILNRMRSYGVPRDTLTDPDRFRLALPNSSDEILDVVADARTWRPTLAIIDSIGELLPIFDANSNDADDFTRVNRQVLAALARTDVAVLAIDHEAKSVESRNYGPTGSAAKKRAVDGGMLRVTAVRPFAPGAGGEAQLSIVKDRHGALREHAVGTREPTLTAFTLTQLEEGLGYRFSTPAAPSLLVEDLDDVDVLLGLVPPPASVKDVKTRLRWGGDRASAALRQWRERTGTPPPDTAFLASLPGTTPEERSEERS